ncbi:MAG: ATP phosphoribosyltransferase regulatory subunit [Gammaproteobacteria bacterium]|nr:ATP phosphoribosyltransferase regulatory subunit [Gammaproteobacteria bacterium]
MSKNPWLLPDGIDELLPEDARRLESMHRRLVDLFDVWGYDLVIPPMIEFLESLLSGAGSDLDLKTFKLVDQLTGRTMGVRADMTPQVARIDAHHLRHDAPTRLCYLGPVLHTRADELAGTRSPYQVGAELYGHAGSHSDAEVLCLMIEALRAVGVQDLFIDLGHVGIYRGLAERARLDVEQEAILFELLQRKALPEIVEYLESLDITETDRDQLAGLATLNGDSDVLQRARVLLKNAGDSVTRALDGVEQVAAVVNQRLPEISLHYDLAELRGYHYQTGMVFAAFVPGYGQEIARGGRYDDIGRIFGRPRPATGFSADLRSVIACSRIALQPRHAILAPAVEDTQIYQCIDALRAKGERVIIELPGQAGNVIEMGCDRRLRQLAGKWAVTPLEDNEIFGELKINE